MDGLSDGWPKAMTDALYYKYYYHISPLLACLLLMGLMMNYKALCTIIRNLEGVICYAFVNCMMFNAVFQQYFSYIALESAPIYASQSSILPQFSVKATGFFPT